MAGRRGYSKARENLRRDFDHRCAYCMTHEDRIDAGSFDIDHFRPRSRGGRANDYQNLYWSCKPCNSSKGVHWPTVSERRQGRRFADPCAEHDYGGHFVEVEMGVLEAMTACGEFHILRLRLNRPWLVARRQERRHLKSRVDAAVRELSRIRQTTGAAECDALADLLTMLEEGLATAIPFIPRRIG